MTKPATPPKSPPAADGRGPHGRFTPGSSGNPQGRPKSETAALRQSLADGAADVVTVILKAAKAGDMQAAQAVHLALPETASPLDIAPGESRWMTAAGIQSILEMRDSPTVSQAKALLRFHATCGRGLSHLARHKSPFVTGTRTVNGTAQYLMSRPLGGEVE